MSNASVTPAGALLEVRQLAKSFGALRATDQVDLAVTEGETHAIIGPNGAGKTTLIGQLAGNLAPDAGSIHFSGEDITREPAHRRSRRGLSRSFQITSVYRDFTALENVALAVQAHAGHSFRFWGSARKDRSLTGPAMQLLQKVNLQNRSDVLAANLSHGEQRQLEIAMALAGRPRLLLLDEPVAGMGIEDAQRMIGFLAGLKGATTMILVEHDMDAVFTLADRISVLVYGRIIATGAPAEIRANREVQRAYLGEDA
jgi:branched-chain amino acid transport system ATP-binding protein